MRVSEETIAKVTYEKGPGTYGLQAVVPFLTTKRFKGFLPEHYADKLRPRYAFEIVSNSPHYIVPFYAITSTVSPVSLCAGHLTEILKECHPTTQ